MRKFIFAVITFIGLGAISCSHNPKNKETAKEEEEEIGCLCCPVEEVPTDSLDIID